MTGSPHGRRSRPRPGDAVEIDVRALGRCDVGTIGDLARIALLARRAGRSVRLVGAPPELVELVALSGLTRVLPCAPPPVSRDATAGRTSETSGPCRERT
jgi:ABC-type transporter Mla MlaB component